MVHLHLIYKPAKKIWTVVVKIRTRKLLQLLKIHLRTLNSYFCLHIKRNKSFHSPPKNIAALLKRKGSVGITFFKNVSYTCTIKYTEINTDHDLAGRQMRVWHINVRNTDICAFA